MSYDPSHRMPPRQERWPQATPADGWPPHRDGEGEQASRQDARAQRAGGSHRRQASPRSPVATAALPVAPDAYGTADAYGSTGTYESAAAYGTDSYRVDDYRTGSYRADGYPGGGQAGTGYGQPGNGYGQPGNGYGQAENGYGQAGTGYGSDVNGYANASVGFDSPPDGYPGGAYLGPGSYTETAYSGPGYSSPGYPGSGHPGSAYSGTEYRGTGTGYPGSGYPDPGYSETGYLDPGYPDPLLMAPDADVHPEDWQADQERRRAAGHRGRMVSAATELLATAVVIGVSTLAAGLLRSPVSPVGAMGAVFIDRTPAVLRNFALHHFGTHGRTVLLLGMYAAIAVIAIAIGVAARRSAALGVTGVVAFTLVAAFVTVTRPASHVTDVWPAVIGGLAGAAALLWLVRASTPVQELEELAPPRPARGGTRRRTR